MSDLSDASEGSNADAEVIKKVLGGDREAFRLLVKRYERMVYTLCLRMLRNRHDAEDCAQVTFIKAYSALGTYRRRYSFKSWIYRIAANVCIDALRRSKQHLRVPLNIEETSAELPIHQADQRRSAAAKELRRAVGQALGMLADKYRLPLTLFYLEGLECAEISAMLSLRLGTVKTRIRRGRLLLREIIENKWPELVSEGVDLV